MNTTPSSPLYSTSTTASGLTAIDHDQPQFNSKTTTNKLSEQFSGTALVLAGAGAAGNAWELGLIAALLEAGLDMTEAELIIGTSAGSTVAAQITSGTRPSELYAAILAEARQTPAGDAGSGRGRAPNRSGTNYMEWSDEIIGSAEDASDMRRKIGAAALEMDTPEGSYQTRWHDIVASRLPSHHWSQQRVLIPAVDASTGEPFVFDRHSGVDLVDAVAASTSAMRPYRIGENRYINGGYRRNENADLAAGCERVLVLSPFGGRTRHPLAWGMQLAAQVDELRAGGSRVETVFPDSSSEHLFGVDALNPSLRLPAAMAGYNQGRILAGELTEFWR